MDHDDLQPDDLGHPGRSEHHVPGGEAAPEPAEPVEPVEPVDPQPILEEDDPYDIPEIPDLPDLPDDETGVSFEAPDLDQAVELLDDIDDVQLGDQGVDGSVDLQLDRPLEADQGGGGPPPTDRAADGGDVDLSLDPEQGDLDHIPTDDADQPDGIDLPLPEEPPPPFDVADGNAWLNSGLIAAALVAIGASAPVLARLRRATPPDLAAHLDRLGIDARVEHLDLTGLEELLAGGGTVLLSTDGSAGVDASAVLRLRSIDRPSGRALVSDPNGARSFVELALFEAAWSDSANQVVIATGNDGGVALVPVVLGAGDLVGAR